MKKISGSACARRMSQSVSKPKMPSPTRPMANEKNKRGMGERMAEKNDDAIGTRGARWFNYRSKARVPTLAALFGR